MTLDHTAAMQSNSGRSPPPLHVKEEAESTEREKTRSTDSRHTNTLAPSKTPHAIFESNRTEAREPCNSGCADLHTLIARVEPNGCAHLRRIGQKEGEIPKRSHLRRMVQIPIIPMPPQHPQEQRMQDKPSLKTYGGQTRKTGRRNGNTWKVQRMCNLVVIFVFVFV
jgi:hypothetical protein